MTNEGQTTMRFEELTEKVIGCAYAVHNKMGFGFLEGVYQKCLMIELRKAGLACRAQEPLRVYYGDEPVGEYVADIIVEDCLILELKSTRSIAKRHEVQLVNYLTATGMDVGLVINFGAEKVEVRRKVRSLEQLGESRRDEKRRLDGITGWTR